VSVELAWAGVPEELLAALAHELRTPVAVIIGYAELLANRADEGTRLEAAARIKEAGERLMATLDERLGQAGPE